MARVLVVDDDPRTLEVFKQFLSLWGHTALVARDGRSAVEQARSGNLDAIVLDVLMPDMDGYEVCRRLKADPALRDVPVIFLTASDDPQVVKKAFEAGGLACLLKPIDGTKLRSTLGIALKSAQLRKLKPPTPSSR